MFILFVIILTAFFFPLFEVLRCSHSSWLFVDSAVVWFVHFAPDEVNFLLEKNITRRKLLVTLYGCCGPQLLGCKDVK